MPQEAAPWGIGVAAAVDTPRVLWHTGPVAVSTVPQPEGSGTTMRTGTVAAVAAVVAAGNTEQLCSRDMLERGTVAAGVENIPRALGIVERQKCWKEEDTGWCKAQGPAEGIVVVVVVVVVDTSAESMVVAGVAVMGLEAGGTAGERSKELVLSGQRWIAGGLAVGLRGEGVRVWRA